VSLILSAQNAPPGLDHRRLLGAWWNTDAGASGGILRLIITERAGALRLRVLGAGPGGSPGERPRDWGAVDARGYADAVTGTEAWACTARYDLGFMTVRMSAYTKAGILVVTTYNTFHRARGRAAYYTREFFHIDNEPQDGEPEPLRGAASGDLSRARERYPSADPGASPRVNPTPLAGTWRNFDTAATNLARIAFTVSDGALVARPFGIWKPSRHDWHPATAAAYSEDVARTAGAAFTAAFDVYQRHVHMVGYVNRRLLTVETAVTPVGRPGHAPSYVREHFYPIRAGTGARNYRQRTTAWE
jgi:hypothetical protein